MHIVYYPEKNISRIIRLTAAFAFLPLLLVCETALAQSTTVRADTVEFRPVNPLSERSSLYEIMEITVSGNYYYSDPFIIATSDLNVGENIRIPGPEITEAVKRLHNTGLFSDIKIFKEEVGRDGVNLEIVVEEPPRLEDFTVSGVRRSQRRDLRNAIPLIPGFSFTQASERQAIRAIERYYDERGYLDPQVEVIVTDADTVRNRISVDFRVDRGDRIQIGDIRFDGNESFSDRRLRRNLGEIKRNRWWRVFTRQTYNDRDFREAKEEMLQFYRTNGFLDARVVEDSVYVFTRRRDKEALGVFLRIEEGPQYRVRNIAWEGNTIYSDEELTEALGFERGEIFNEEKFEKNLRFDPRTNADVTSMYNDIGYLFFRVDPEFNFVQGDSIDISLFIVEDEIATVRRVDFSGNTKTHDDVVRRTLRNLPGSRYSRSAIIRSIRELSQLGYFNPENIDPVLEDDYEEKTVDIIYNLDESMSTDNFEFSGGYGGRLYGIIVSAKVNFNNFSAGNIFNSEAWRPLPSGDGQRLSLGVQVTGRGYQNFSFGFQEPWFLGRPNSLGVNLSYSLFSGRGIFGTVTTGRQEMFMASVSYGRRLSWPDDYFRHISRLRYQYFDVDQYRNLLGGQSNVLALEQEIQRNSVDNPISPRIGSRMSLKFEVAPPLPGFSQYYKAGLSFQFHTPIVGKLVSSYGAEYGYLNWFSTTNQSQFERFYMGGTPMQQQHVFTRDNIDMRGYPGGFDGSISPYRDGVEQGGTIYNKYFVEIRYPLVQTEQLQLTPYLFTEAGNSFAGYSDFDPFNLKRAAGFGTRIFLPILGLIDLSYGYRFDGLDTPNVNAGEWQFLFNIGTPFF